MSNVCKAYHHVHDIFNQDKGWHNHCAVCETFKLREHCDNLLAALEDIAEGKGPYSRNQLTHAWNCIEEMKATAQAAIAKAKGATT